MKKSEHPLEEYFRPNTRHDGDDAEIEDNYQRDDAIASASSSVRGMLGLLEQKNVDSSTSDDIDHSDDDNSAMVPPALDLIEDHFKDSEMSGDDSDKDSSSDMPPLIRHRSCQYAT